MTDAHAPLKRAWVGVDMKAMETVEGTELPLEAGTRGTHVSAAARGRSGDADGEAGRGRSASARDRRRGGNSARGARPAPRGGERARGASRRARGGHRRAERPAADARGGTGRAQCDRPRAPRPHSPEARPASPSRQRSFAELSASSPRSTPPTQHTSRSWPSSRLDLKPSVRARGIRTSARRGAGADAVGRALARRGTKPSREPLRRPRTLARRAGRGARAGAEAGRDARGRARTPRRRPLRARGEPCTGAKRARGSESRRPRTSVPRQPGRSSLTHLRFVLRAGGYTVTQCEGEPPEIGQLVELDGERFIVAKTGPSPFPYDRRPCAYLLVDVGPTARSARWSRWARRSTWSQTFPLTARAPTSSTRP